MKFYHSSVAFLLFILIQKSYLYCETSSISYGNLIYQDDFSTNSMSNWTIVNDATNEPSDWYVQEGYLIQHSNIGESLFGTHIVTGDINWTNYAFRAEMISGDDDYIGVVFRYQNPDNYYRFYLSSQAKKIRFEKRVNGVSQSLRYISEKWEYCRFTITVALSNDSISIYLNDKKYVQLIDSSLTHGKVGFMTCNDDGAFFDNIAVYDKIKIEEKEPELAIWWGPYIQQVLGDSATVMWKTNRSADSDVEFGTTPTPQWHIHDNSYTKTHEINITGLQRNTRYFYRVKSGDIVSDWYFFYTAKKDTATKLRFALYSDSQLNFLRHAEIAQAMSAYQLDFVVSAGDLCHGGHREDYATEFFYPMQDILYSVPIYVSIGNHAKASSRFTEHFAFPNKEHETYYSIKYANTFFIFLDNARSAYPDETIYPEIGAGSAQYNWLVDELASPDAQFADWLFVVSHVPYYSECTGDIFEENQEQLVPLFEQYGVDAVFSGHIHTYERGNANGVTYIITGGGGGSLGSTRRRDIPQIDVVRFGHHFNIIEIDGKRMEFTSYDTGNISRDYFVIDKTNEGTSIQNPQIPANFSLSNFPNPFNGRVQIKYSIPKTSELSLKIYDLTGSEIADLIKNVYHSAGEYQFDWQPEGLSSGCYIFSMQIDNTQYLNKKVVYLK